MCFLTTAAFSDRTLAPGCCAEAEESQSPAQAATDHTSLTSVHLQRFLPSFLPSLAPEESPLAVGALMNCFISITNISRQHGLQ
ncbi:hypothetical protein CesoFtcFv8_005561 [Champsocephalus esox]|uniref:Uncharacterized protein n=1 Tax=Champsocephalus esox TaxID=159716 RepID=A0AAN8CQ70_9TELE|nr:hypothetical protein CesoFtcFv8_005561 [Champsocephalus esox]